jgi:hypothetical protein
MLQPDNYVVVNHHGLVPIANWKQLESLKIAGAKDITLEFLHALAEGCKQLKSLDFGRVFVDTDGLEEVVKACSLVSIDLGMNRAKDVLITINKNRTISVDIC